MCNDITAYGYGACSVDDLDETPAELAAQGIEPEQEPYRVRERGSRICFVRGSTDAVAVYVVASWRDAPARAEWPR